MFFAHSALFHDWYSFKNILIKNTFVWYWPYFCFEYNSLNISQVATANLTPNIPWWYFFFQKKSGSKLWPLLLWSAEWYRQPSSRAWGPTNCSWIPWKRKCSKHGKTMCSQLKAHGDYWRCTFFFFFFLRTVAISCLHWSRKRKWESLAF